MAVYDGFFNAVLDEGTGEYDRTYNSGDFTEYFEKIIGSGVCIHKNPDSFKVRFEGGSAVVSPGYLFILGYWLKNDADYTIPVTGTATLAIAAHLNMGKRMIELEAVSVAQAYPDSLVLALVNPAAGTAEDTRHNTDICGVIDSAGELSKKVEWAVNYINNEVETRISALETSIAAQSKQIDTQYTQTNTELDEKYAKANEDVDAEIAAADAQIQKITPPPVGTIQYSAAQTMGEKWLRCDGSFVNSADYPELVDALGKLTPSGDKLQLLSDGEIPQKISNGAICNGRMWVFSYSSKKLYGVDLEGTKPIKEISMSGDANFSSWLTPSNDRPIALSIIPLLSNPGHYKLFLAQHIGSGYAYNSNNTKEGNTITVTGLGPNKFLIYCSDFSGEETSLKMVRPFSSVTATIWYDNDYMPNGQTIGEIGNSIPYVTSRILDGIEKFYCIPCGPKADVFDYKDTEFGYVTWSNGDRTATLDNSYLYSREMQSSSGSRYPLSQILSFNKKNKNELIFVSETGRSAYDVMIQSIPDKYFDRGAYTYDIMIGGFGPKITTNTLYGGEDRVVVNAWPNLSGLTTISRTKVEKIEVSSLSPPLSLPSAKRVFLDAGAYLWGKAIYMLFVGTGIIFSRSSTSGTSGYLDTTDALGTITQFGYLDYSEDEGTLYLLGQDTENHVKVAKMVLNTLYDYATDGAWLPSMSMDGIPAYIKAIEG